MPRIGFIPIRGIGHYDFTYSLMPRIGSIPIRGIGHQSFTRPPMPRIGFIPIRGIGHYDFTCSLMLCIGSIPIRGIGRCLNTQSLKSLYPPSPTFLYHHLFIYSPAHPPTYILFPYTFSPSSISFLLPHLSLSHSHSSSFSSPIFQGRPFHFSQLRIRQSSTHTHPRRLSFMGRLSSPVLEERQLPHFKFPHLNHFPLWTKRFHRPSRKPLKRSRRLEQGT
jgi:hypothetical protein